MTFRRTTRYACTAGLFLLTGFALDANASSASFAANEARLAHPDGKVMVVSHRGCWKYTAENSLSGIDKCVALGVDMVEIDVRRTRDGDMVLMHDETVDRTTNGHGKVRDLTAREVRSLRQRAHGGGNEPLTDRHVPTLDEALDRVKGRILVNLDIKDDDIYDAVIARVVARKMGPQVLVKRSLDTDRDDVQRWGRQLPFSVVLPVTAHGPGASELIRRCNDLPVVAVELLLGPGTGLDGVASAARSLSIHVWVNTLATDVASHRSMNMSAGHDDVAAQKNPDAAWGWLFDHGVDIIQTDEPARALDYFTKRGLHADVASRSTGQ